MQPSSVSVRRLALSMLFASSISCSRPCPKAPQHPCPACPPATITVSPDRPPCVLPSWPSKPLMGGVPELGPDHKETGNVTITRDGLGELARFVAGAVKWAEAATLCLEAR